VDATQGPPWQALHTCYSPEAIAAWAQGVRAWTSGKRPREVFVYFINGAKERAPPRAIHGARATLAQAKA